MADPKQNHLTPVWRIPVNRRAAEWSLFIGTFWGLIGVVAALDPSVKTGRAWQPIRSFTGSLEPWIMAWWAIFVFGVLASWTRRFVWHMLTQAAGLLMSGVWVLSTLAVRYVNGENISFAAVLLWMFPGAAIVLFAIRGAAPTRRR